jgi:hypothetical protein
MLAPVLHATLEHATTSMPAQKLGRWPVTDTTAPALLRRH